MLQVGIVAGSVMYGVWEMPVNMEFLLVHPTGVMFIPAPTVVAGQGTTRRGQ